MVLFGGGLGLVLQVLVIAMQNAVPWRTGLAPSAATFFRSLGGSFGTALFGAVLSARLTSEIARRLPGMADSIPIADLTGSPAMLAELPTEIQTPLVEALSTSITDVFLVGIPFALTALVLVLLLPELPLRDTPHLTSRAAEI